MAKNFGLGRGLGSLIPKTDHNTKNKNKQNDSSNDNNFDFNDIEKLLEDDSEKVYHISPAEIKVNPYQPRNDFNRRELEELIDSIREHGIIQPLVVTRVDDGYQLIAGERRLRASKVVELDKVPVIVREVDSVEKLELALIENIQRSNLSAVEEALAYRKLADEFSFTQEQIAKKVGKSRPSVANIMRVLTLPQEIQDAISRGQITFSHAKVILSAEKPGEQKELYQKCLVGNLNVSELTREANKFGKKTPRKVKDLSLEVKEDKLRLALGTKVNIKKRGNKGKIEIEFYEDEDLEKIVGQICD